MAVATRAMCGPRRVVCLAALSFVVACGDDDAPKKADQASKKVFASDGKSEADRKSAKAVADYFERNARTQAWFGKLRSVRVAGGVVTFESTLDLGAEIKAGREICVYLQGSDEADFTKGSAVLGTADTRYECAARPKP